MDDTFVLAEAHPREPVEPLPRQAAREQDLIANLQAELLGYYAIMQKLNNMEPTEVFQKLSSFSARASEVRTMLVRVDSRRSTNFRTKEIDPFLTECDRQFKIHSRIQATREMEVRLLGGQF